MTVLLSASGLFLLAFVIHLAWWRLRTPRRQTAALLQVFLVTAAGGFALIASVSDLSLPRLLLAILLFGSLAVAYIILFTALEADSPTLTLIGLIARAGSHGIRRDDLLLAVERHAYVRLRLDQMIADGMAIETAGGVRLARQGLWLSSLVLFYRRLLGRRQLGG
jgi:hypothetical protein